MQTKRRAPEEVAITDGRKIARELFGLFLIFWGLLVLLSLVSFDQNDPSINHAVSNPAIVKNYAGLFGAYLSGLLVDIFGFAALVWPLVFLAWGAGCVSTWFTMPWWRWFGFTLLAACLISLGAAWNLGIGDVRGGGMLGMTLYTKFTTLFSPVGSSLIWLFLLFISLEMAFGIAWLALIRKGWALLKEQLSGTPLSLDDLPERLSKVSMPKVALPKIGLPQKDKKSEEETASSVIPLFEIHDEEGKTAETFEAALTVKGCEKASEFIRFCDAFEIPVLSITNVTGFKACMCAEKGLAKALAHMTSAFASATCPKVNLIAGDAFGSAYVTMNSKSIGADLVYAWPETKIGMMDAELAAKIMYADASADVLAEKAKEYEKLQSNVVTAARRGYVDLIIEPADTRKYLVAAFEMLYTKCVCTPDKKHGTK